MNTYIYKKVLLCMFVCMYVCMYVHMYITASIYKELSVDVKF